MSSRLLPREVTCHTAPACSSRRGLDMHRGYLGVLSAPRTWSQRRENWAQNSSEWKLSDETRAKCPLGVDSEVGYMRRGVTQATNEVPDVRANVHQERCESAEGAGAHGDEIGRASCRER